MSHKRPDRSRDRRRVTTGMDDLFATAPRERPVTANDEYWSVRQIAARTGLARSTIYRYVRDGVFPRQRQLGPGRVAWLASDVQHWMATRPRGNPQI